MWRYLAILFCGLTTTAYGAEFSGKYQGVMADVPMQLVLKQNGDTLSGTMKSNNSDTYQITGTVNGDVATGDALYTKNNTSWGFVLNLSDDGLVWIPTMLGMPLQNAATTFERAGATASRSASAGGAAAGGQWSKELLGRELALISSGTGYYSQKTLFLCRNGTYRTSSDSGNFGGGAVIGSSGGASGRWQASGPANGGLLILRTINGSQQTYKVNISDEGFYLDGTKWLRGDDSGC